MIHQRYSRRDNDSMVDRDGILRRGDLFGRSWSKLRRRDWLLQGGPARAALTDRGWWQACPLLLTDDPCRRRDKCRLDHDWSAAPRHYIRIAAHRPLGGDEIRRIGALPGRQRRLVVIDARQIAVVWPG